MSARSTPILSVVMQRSVLLLLPADPRKLPQIAGKAWSILRNPVSESIFGELADSESAAKRLRDVLRDSPTRLDLSKAP